MEWAEFPWRGQAQSCGVAQGDPAWSVCGPGLWGQKSENTNSAQVWARGYGKPDLKTLQGAPQDMNEGRV